jgi:hypothetical protein
LGERFGAGALDCRYAINDAFEDGNLVQRSSLAEVGGYAERCVVGECVACSETAEAAGAEADASGDGSLCFDLAVVEEEY